MIARIITLPSATERHTDIISVFQNQNIPFKFERGVSENEMQFHANPPHFVFQNTKIPLRIANILACTNRSWIRFGEMAALMAHYRLWKELVNSQDNCYLICEDDCRPAKNFNPERLAEFDYNKIDLLYLQAITAHYQPKQRMVDSLPQASFDSTLKEINNTKGLICEGLAAYCISKTGAKKLCDHIETHGYDGPVDNIITRLPNFQCYCPSDIINYFDLAKTSNYSYTHTSDIWLKKNLGNIEIQSKKPLNIVE